MTFIIAEVGSNFTSLQDCLVSIVAAKDCGADAVKFQMYTHKELYGYDCRVEWMGIQSGHDYVMPGTLPREWVPVLHQKCQEVGIEFMCTAFSPEGYRFIDPYVKRHKIASAEASDPNIQAAVLGLILGTEKEVLVSTGGSSLEEIKQIVTQFDDKLTLMYCVSAYPAKNIDFAKLDVLRDAFPNIPLGYSCHTDEWMTPVYPLLRQEGPGLTVIEKHFKLRDMDTPDNPHSIKPCDFARMVNRIKTGKTNFPDLQELDFIKYSKRRFIPELNGYYRTKKP